MNGKEIWRFEDTSFLRSPRGVVVDNHGFVFVAGEHQELIGFGLQVEPSNSFLLVTIIKFTITVSNSITSTIIVRNVL
jgi:hypothetical protein